MTADPGPPKAATSGAAAIVEYVKLYQHSLRALVASLPEGSVASQARNAAIPDVIARSRCIGRFSADRNVTFAELSRDEYDDLCFAVESEVAGPHHAS